MKSAKEVIHSIVYAGESSEIMWIHGLGPIKT